jgi:hypothetical protein
VGEFVLELIVRIVVEVVLAAWRHDFPDPPERPARADVVDVSPQPPLAHPLWDREIDVP